MTNRYDKNISKYRETLDMTADQFEWVEVE